MYTVHMKANILKPKEVGNTRYSLPKSLVGAAGMLKGKLPDGLKYQKKIRKEWGERLRKLESRRRNAKA